MRVLKSLAVPLAAAAFLRLTLAAVAFARTGSGAIAGGDTASYFEPGRNLLLHGSFSTAGLPEIGRTPGYPLFLALTSSGGTALAVLAQVLLGVLCVCLVARLARQAGLSECAVQCSAWLFAFEPLATIYSVRLLSETLFCAIFLLSLERLVAFLQTRNLRSLAGAGFALAAAIYVRPAAYFLPFLLAGTLAALFWKNAALRWKAPALFLLCILPWLVLWQLRNFAETGFAGFSSIATRNLYFYSAAEAEARATGERFELVQQRFGYANEAAYLALHPEQKNWSEGERLAFMRAEAKRILRVHGIEALRTQAVGSVVVLFTPGAGDLLPLLRLEAGPARVVHSGPLQAAFQVIRQASGRAVILAAMELWLLALYFFALRGVTRQKFTRGTLPVFALTALYFVLISGGVQAVGRYRLPILPLVCILAAAGLSRRKSSCSVEF